MCRWSCYISNQSILAEDLFVRPSHALMKQVDNHYLPGIQHPAADFGVGDSNPFSNADGSGFGWYNDIQSKFDPTDTLPALMPTAVHTEHPPLHDLNLKALMKSVASTVLVGHIRAVVGSPISIVNSHPFTFGRWLFLHNGSVDAFFDAQDPIRARLSRAAKANIKGTTDTETVAALFFTHLEPDGPWLVDHTPDEIFAALRATIADLVEICTPKEGWLKEDGTLRTFLTLNLAFTDGEQFTALRYSYPPEREAPSLYWSVEGGSSLDRRHERHPDGGQDVGNIPHEDHAPHLVVGSEPLTKNPEDNWHLIEPGQVVYTSKAELAASTEKPFRPRTFALNEKA